MTLLDRQFDAVVGVEDRDAAWLAHQDALDQVGVPDLQEPAAVERAVADRDPRT
ncbi:MAG: hypothetical protein R3D25_10070 [Geminicoccaceae bacterium]